jgi:hypothetical protein
MSETSSEPRPSQPGWADSGWLGRLLRWLEVELSRLGVGGLVDLGDLQICPWSAIYRVRTDSSGFILKACSPSLAHEPRVTQYLADRFPDSIPEVLAISQAERWMLLPTYDSRMRDTTSREGLLAAWERILPAYATIQRQLAVYEQPLGAMGVPDRRPSALPGLLEALLARFKDGWLASAATLTPSERLDVMSLVPDLRVRCELLQGAAVGVSLNHGDLHDGNIFMEADGFRLLDWGDCSLSHPFFSLRTTFVSIENAFGLGESDRAFDRLRDAYLEAWTEVLPRKDLRELFSVARQVWALPSALSWDLALTSLDTVEGSDCAAPVPHLLVELVGSLQRDSTPGLGKH